MVRTQRTNLPIEDLIDGEGMEEALNELHAAVTGLRAVAHRADAVAAKTVEEGPRRGIERVGIRAAV
jgi:hypothetical protein